MAAAALLATATTTLVPDGNSWLAPNLWVLAIDTLLLTALIAIALRSDRWFPIWSAGLQLVGVTVHLGSILAPGYARDVYFLLQALWAVPVLMALVIGVVLDRRASIDDDPQARRR
ncbi:hypothetical protein RZN05_02290 [Sphingomonas sp. HF-S4]|uniref:Uncharacterized protein n=1 Tax=Sphingomonas agrestis TaxID=3080540 RepID=A0ABU3Y3K4_9SPHN|nr:hypothetical protein [Sphingomonas sp. HF-S4]MDV3455798.1 hypothetical protein [Sphingomonas sp. HF-S4]